MSKNTVAVIMTAYNESEEWIKQSVESILEQTYKDIHFYILIDNPDNIKLRKVLEEYREQDERISLYVNEKNIGLVKSLNKLIYIVEENYVARMDADDVSKLDRIEKEFEFLNNNELDFVMSGVDFLIDDKVEEGLVVPEIKGDSFRECQKYGNFATHPTWLLKRKVYLELEGYRELKYCEDYDFVLRALQKGCKLGRMPEKLLNYRVRSSGISSSYAYDQFMKADYIRNKYRRGENLSLYDVNELNGKFDDETEKLKFEKAKSKVDKFALDLYNKRYFRCFLNVISGYFTSASYRRFFNYTVSNRIKLQRIIRSIDK